MNVIVGWFRRVYPPMWAVLIVLSVVGVCEALFWWLLLDLSVPIEQLTEGLRIRDSVVLLSVGGYAVFRVVAFHPFFRPQYCQWLSQTPWTADKPLPLGPVMLVAQDLLLIVLLRLCLHDYQMLETALPLVFLFTYVVVVTVAICASGARSVAYVLMFGLGLAVRCCWWTPWAALVVLAACYVVAVYGIKRSLLAFPWTPEIAALRRHFSDSRKVPETGLAANHLGWPYYLLNAEDIAPDLSRGERVIISLAAGWNFYALAAAFSDDMLDSVEGVVFGISALTVLCVVGRLGLYFANFWPPISIWGRLRTGRWIIPAYDSGFLAPLAVLMIGLGGSIALNVLSRQQPHLVAPLAGLLVSSVLFTTFLAGPSHRRWRLTTPCRLAPLRIGTASQFEKL